MFSPPPVESTLPLCCNNITVHYRFDFAQQVHYPAYPFQPVLIYFLTPRKCGVFSICCESIPCQMMYLVDDGVYTGKGANIIISYLHYFFATHGLGEKVVHLHANNCVRQNKNNAMLHYLLWRILCNLHKSITLSFLIVGHTKFSPDMCFGLFKQRARRSRVTCLEDIVTSFLKG